MDRTPEHPTAQGMEILARLKVHALASRVHYWRKYGGKHAAPIGVSTKDRPEALEEPDPQPVAKRGAIPF